MYSGCREAAALRFASVWIKWEFSGHFGALVIKNPPWSPWRLVVQSLLPLHG